MAEQIDFKAFHEAYYEKLKKDNPDNKYCIMCFDNRNISDNLCEDCIYIQNLLSKIKPKNDINNN